MFDFLKSTRQNGSYRDLKTNRDLDLPITGRCPRQKDYRRRTRQLTTKD